MPRTTPAVAAVHAALWATSDKQATYLLTLVVQQGLARPSDLSDAASAVRRHPRRRLLSQVVLDLARRVRGAWASSTSPVPCGVAGCPSRRAKLLRRRASGTQYLDADFPAYGITLEVDGAQHDLPGARLADLLRDLGLASDGRTMVRLPLVAWRWTRQRCSTPSRSCSARVAGGAGSLTGRAVLPTRTR